MYLLETKDKTERIIYLTNERWSHILQEHPEVSFYFYDFETILKHPTKIVFAEYDNKVGYYYKFYKKNTGSVRYLLLLVKYLNGKGFIITAYFTK